MYKNKGITIYIIGITSLVMSIIAIFVACYRTENLGFDYQGVIVGVLSLLVTALLGWQIYSTIAMEERVRKIADTIASERTNELQRSLYWELSGTYESLTVTSIDARKVLDAIFYNNQHAICALFCSDLEKAKKVIENMVIITKIIKNGNVTDKHLLELLSEHVDKLKILLPVYPDLAKSYVNLLHRVETLCSSSRT